MATEEKKETAIAKPQPTVQDWLRSNQFHEAVQKALPSHLTPDRFIRVALTAMMRTPKLAQCSRESIFKAMLDLSSLGLEPDGRRAHLIPFDVKEKGTGRVLRTEAQLIIDYKGIIELSKRSGDVANWRAEIVCEADVFSWSNGIVSHDIDWRKPRGKMQAVYSHVRTKDGIDDYEVMSKDQVDGIRKRSKAANNGPWVTDFDEMAKKTVMRRHSKRLTLSPEFRDALEKDADRIDFEDMPAVDLMPRRASEPAAAIETTAAESPEPAQGEDAATEAVPTEPPPPPPAQPEPTTTAAPKHLSEKQLGRLFAIAKGKGYGPKDVEEYVTLTFECSVKEMTRENYDRACEFFGGAK